ncbi:LPS assembly protein LptD [Rubritalea sp.]|uniref:LPS assembly protein LptD n=1 Tax=Rubritalea sp. TaxID=2109375 RepID=UPI003EF3E0E5
MNRIAASLASILLSTSCFGQELEPSGFSLQLSPTMPENLRITSENGAEYNHDTGLVRYPGGVQVYANNGMQIFADQALVDSKKSTLHLRGNVKVYQNSTLHIGSSASYNYDTEKLDTSNLKTGMDPILLDSENFKSQVIDGKLAYIGTNSRLTTHDKENPNFWLKAKKVEIYPDEEIVFRNLTLRAGDTPIFWLPYLKQSLDTGLGYQFKPGVKSNWGPFLLNQYNIMLGGTENPVTGRKEDQWLLSEWKFDIRSKRGLAAGLDLSDTRLGDNSNLGWLRTYYANDLDPTISRNGIPRESISDNRYKIEFKNRYDWSNSPDSENIIDANFTYLSDQYYLQDFDPNQYTLNPRPDNILGYQHRRDYLQAGVFARVQLNDFYQADSRLPEIYLDQVKRPIFGTNILHEGSSSIGIYREDLGDVVEDDLKSELASTNISSTDGSEIYDNLADKKFSRLHTYQELSRPIEIADGFTVTPRAGAGYTYYWDEGDQDQSYSAPLGHIGLDAALKISRKYSSIKSNRWGLDELLHVIQPYTNISILATDELDDDQPKIDRLTATERPRPLDVSRYTAIDDYKNWSIARLGTRNTLLTKRNGGTHRWLTLDSYIDAFLNDPEFDRQFSNFYNDLRWSPVPWTYLSLNTQFPVSGQGFTELSTFLSILPTENLELGLGHSYLSNHPEIADSNQVNSRIFFRLNHKWSFATYHQYQLDDNVLERQEYSIYRNFQSWTMGLGMFQRDNRLKKEYGALINISLNALPTVNLPFSLDAGTSQ